MRKSLVSIQTIVSFMLIACLATSVFYFSWLPSPDIGSQPYFPKGIGKWVNNYGNLRTAIPFIFLGALCESLIKTSSNARGMVCLGLAVLVSMAEVGQLFLAERHFDVADIGWGIAGSVLGIILGITLKMVTRFIIK